MSRPDSLTIEQMVPILVQVTLTDSQTKALLSLVSDIGYFNFRISSLLRAINSQDNEAISTQWLRWATTDGRVDPVRLTLRQSELATFLAPNSL